MTVDTATDEGVCGSPMLIEGTSPGDEISGYETHWTSIPAGPDGQILPTDQWPAELRDHPAIAQVNTWNGTLVEAFDRTGCRDLSTYAVQPDPAWPAQSIVIVDIDTGEVLDSFPIDINGNTLP